MGEPSDLDSVVEAILVDAYGDEEQYVAFLTVLQEETQLPAAATLLGAPVTVTGFDYTEQAGRCAPGAPSPSPTTAARSLGSSPSTSPARWNG